MVTGQQLAVCGILIEDGKISQKFDNDSKKIILEAE